MRLTRLDTLDLPGQVAAFNLVYTAYVVPATVDEVWMAQHMSANDIDLARSPLLVDDAGAVAGMALLGVRGERGWVGGFGIAPDHRGRGLGRRLIQETIAGARAAGIRELQLEVITTNSAAIRTYERASFVRTRDLLVLTRPAGPPNADVDTTAAQDVAADVVLARRERMAAERPVWQREARCFRQLENAAGILVGALTNPLAVALYTASGSTARLLDLAALDVDAAQTVLAALVERLPERSITLVNEPEDSEALPVLLDAGWVEGLRQHEMVLAISS